MSTSSVRFDDEDLAEWMSLLRADHPAVNGSVEIRSLVRRDITERKARAKQNGSAS